MSAPRGGAGPAPRAAALVLTALLPALALPSTPLAAQEDGGAGAQIYDRWCAGCHGVEGDGNGPAAAWMLPRPRDFTGATYQIRTTESGALPTDEDILRVIDEGMPGTSMPGWEEVLSRRERRALVEYVKSFSPFFEDETPEPLEFGRAPRASDEVLAQGREAYETAECVRCHGDAGRGDGPSARTLEDDWDQPVRAVDLTRNWAFDGGGSVEDIYRRLRTGLDGTPMPSQVELLQAGVLSEEDLWALAHYVRSLSPERAPRVREVIAVGRVGEDEELPTSPSDERWEEADRFYVPMVGQIIVEPRWFAPRVEDVWVQGLHDGEDVALRISWTDPSRSPDPRWAAEWRPRVVAAMEPVEGEPVPEGPIPDALDVQFPRTRATGMERPYFLHGDRRRPVHLWRWRSDGEGATAAEARGIGTAEERTAGSTPEATAEWENGEWRLLLRRALATPDTAAEPQLREGEAVPIAFFARDGDNGESGARGSISSWYFLALEPETPAGAYAVPVAALLVTLGFGMVVVRRARRRDEEVGTGGGEAAAS